MVAAVIGDPQRADGIEELGGVGVVVFFLCLLGMWKLVDLLLLLPKPW